MITIFHLNIPGFVYVNIEISNEIKIQNLDFFHKSEDGLTKIILKDKKYNRIIAKFQFYFSSSLRILNIRQVIPEILKINDKSIVSIKYNVTKNLINNNNINCDNIIDYIKKEIGCFEQSDKIILNNIFCKNCNKINIKKIEKELIYDFNPEKIEQSLNEMFQCFHNQNSLKKNTYFNNLFEKFKERINVTDFYLWNIKTCISEEKNKNIICDHCSMILGNYETINHHIFYKFNIFKISLKVNIKNKVNQNKINFFTEKYLYLIFGYLINNNIINIIFCSDIMGIKFKLIPNLINMITIPNLISDENIHKQFFLIEYEKYNILKIQRAIVEEQMKFQITNQDLSILFNILESNKQKYNNEIILYQMNTNSFKEDIFLYKI